jgi:hypothetical protein
MATSGWVHGLPRRRASLTCTKIRRDPENREKLKIRAIVLISLQFALRIV